MVPLKIPFMDPKHGTRCVWVGRRKTLQMRRRQDIEVQVAIADVAVGDDLRVWRGLGDRRLRLVMEGGKLRDWQRDIGTQVLAAALLALATPADDAMRWVFTAVGALALFAMAVNRLVLPHAIGWTLGRALFGLRVAHRSGSPVGVVRLAVRELAR